MWRRNKTWMTMIYAFLSFFDGSLMILLVFNNFPFVDAFFFFPLGLDVLSYRWSGEEVKQTQRVKSILKSSPYNFVMRRRLETWRSFFLLSVIRIANSNSDISISIKFGGNTLLRILFIHKYFFSVEKPWNLWFSFLSFPRTSSSIGKSLALFSSVDP